MQEKELKKSDISERFLSAMDSLNLKPSDLERTIGITMQKMNKIKNGLQKKPSHSDIKSFSETYGVNPAWIYTGQGNMLVVGDKTFNESGKINSVKGQGNIVNVELPESGRQKIIKPDGSIEIQNDNEHQNSTRLADLERIISLKDEIIEAKNNEIETLKMHIEVLKNQQKQF